MKVNFSNSILKKMESSVCMKLELFKHLSLYTNCKIVNNFLVIRSRPRLKLANISLEYLQFPIEIKKLTFYILSKPKIFQIEFEDEYIVLYHYNKGVNSGNRIESYRDIISLKKELNNSKFAFYEYYQYDTYFFQSRKYTEIFGLSNISRERFKDIALFEYIERISSFFLQSKEVLNNVSVDKELDMKKFGYFWTGKSFGASNNFVRVTSTSGDIKYAPLEYIYYNANIENSMDILRGSSNGISIGSTREEAKYYSLLEIYERDSLLKFWYTSKISIKKISSDTLPLKYRLINNLSSIKGYDIEYFIFEQIKGLYTVWCLIKSHDRKNIVFSASGFSSGENILNCIKKSYDEASVGLHFLLNDEKTYELIKKVENTEFNKLNMTINNYIQYYYSSYLREKELTNIVNNAQVVEYQTLKNIYKNKLDLYKLEKILKEIYPNIYYCDLTPDRVQKYGLFCVKALAESARELYFYPVENITGKSKYVPIP